MTGTGSGADGSVTERAGSGDDARTNDPIRPKAELVLTPPGTERRAALARQAMIGFVGDVAVVQFTYRTDPATLYREWRAAVGTEPAGHFVIDASGSSVDAAPAVASDGGTFAAERAHPMDLTGLCMKWQDALAAAGDATPTFVTFDSVTALLQYAETDVAYRFLRTLVGAMHRSPARGHFYLDPDACDEQTVSVLRSAFDAVRRID